ncbi:oligosaccharide flippase family protein [candidate division WWE3 bacterium]|nr:oligosaccharide flippase family protein [candidate division WWE3 bacterium]
MFKAFLENPRVTLKKTLSNNAVSGTLVVTLGSFIGSIFSYLLQIILGRQLSIEDFGTFNTLLSFSMILGVFSGALSTSVIKKVSSLCAKSKFDVMTKLFLHLNVFSLSLGALLFAVLFFARENIANFLNISDINAIISFAAFISLTLFSMLPASYLQGLLRFKAFAFYNVLSLFLRLLIPSALVFMGYSVSAVFLGMVSSSLISVILALLLLKKNFDNFHEVCLSGHFKSVLFFLGPLIFMRVGLTFLNNADIILVKHLFSGVDAGLYSGLVTIGKVLLFGAGSVATVMFPQISAAVASGKDLRKELKGFLMVQVFLVFTGVLVFSLFPRLLTLIMFGEKYLSAVSYVPRFALFVGFYVLINFFVMFFMAAEKYVATVFLLLGVFLQAVLIWFFHDSILQVVNINVLVTGLVLLGLILYYKLMNFKKDLF